MLHIKCKGRNICGMTLPAMTLSVHISRITQPQLWLMRHWAKAKTLKSELERSADFPREAPKAVAVIVICGNRCKSNCCTSTDKVKVAEWFLKLASKKIINSLLGDMVVATMNLTDHRNFPTAWVSYGNGQIRWAQMLYYWRPSQLCNQHIFENCQLLQ